MITVAMLAKIRRMFHREHLSPEKLPVRPGLSRTTVDRWLKRQAGARSTRALVSCFNSPARQSGLRVSCSQPGGCQSNLREVLSLRSSLLLCKAAVSCQMTVYTNFLTPSPMAAVAAEAEDGTGALTSASIGQISALLGEDLGSYFAYSIGLSFLSRYSSA